MTKSIVFLMCVLGGSQAMAQSLLSPTLDPSLESGIKRDDDTKMVKSNQVKTKRSGLIEGSTGIILPGRRMAPANYSKAIISEFENQRITQEEGSKNTKRFMHFSPDSKDASADDLTYGFRENQNKKRIYISVDLSKQQATFSSPDFPSKTMRISSGSKGRFNTEKYAGCYTVKNTENMHYSREYNNGKMPNATLFIQTRGIFFHEGSLASRSHGCIRMSDEDSRFVMNQMRKFKRTIKNPITGRDQEVYDAEVCINTGTVAKNSTKTAPKRPAKPTQPNLRTTLAEAAPEIAPPPPAPVNWQIDPASSTR